MANLQKKQKQFSFLFPLNKKSVKNLRIVTTHIGDLEISGVAYFNPRVSLLDNEERRFYADVDSVKWNGAEVKDLLEAIDQLEEMKDAADAHAHTLFSDVIPVVRIIEPLNYSAI